MNIHPYTINLSDDELFNEETEEFINVKSKKVVLEHSLYSVSLWEMKHNKCFLKHLDHLSKQELVDYIMCMSIGDDITEDDVMYMLSKPEIHKEIVTYLNKRMTASYIREYPNNGRMDNEAKTSELFYYYLVKLKIPVNIVEHWHFSRMVALISIFGAKDDTKHKRNVKEMMADNDAINEERKRKLGTKG